jgi:glycosyltransferase involved in cell wall biosynthesis
MSKAMIELLSNEELYRRLSSGAQKWSKNFDWETTVTKFESFLCSLLATK